MDIRIISDKQRIDYLFKLASRLDDELLAHWARYLCILVSGFVENALRIMLIEYTFDKSHPNVSNFVNKNVKGLTNLNEEKIKQLLGSFNQEWRDILEKTLNYQQKDAIDSILANRHNIAHGRQVGITLVRVKEYYKHIIEVIDLINSECISK